MSQIRSWQELTVWQKAHNLVLLTYRLTGNFPPGERYGLSSQMRRAAVSIASNIVEGFHRRGVRDSLSFYNIAVGSLEELRYQYLLSKDLGYLSEGQYEQVTASAIEVSKLLFAWSKSQRVNASLA